MSEGGATILLDGPSRSSSPCPLRRTPRSARNAAAILDWPLLHLLEAELRRLADLRQRWDEVFGHLAMLIRAVDGWRRLGFASFDHYCSERVGMGIRSVAERAALERRLYEVPHLREAMRERRISYEKARLIARHADEASIDAWMFRSRGGSDDLSNLTSLCAVHHLQGVHKGRIRVSGSAPDQLHWEVGSRARCGRDATRFRL